MEYYSWATFSVSCNCLWTDLVDSIVFLSLFTVRACSTLPQSSPPVGKFTSYSLRIGAHTEKVLLRISLEVRIALFGCKPHSSAMAELYFYRTIHLSSAAHWFFRCFNYSQQRCHGVCANGTGVFAFTPRVPSLYLGSAHWFRMSNLVFRAVKTCFYKWNSSSINSEDVGGGEVTRCVRSWGPTTWRHEEDAYTQLQVQFINCFVRRHVYQALGVSKPQPYTDALVRCFLESSFFPTTRRPSVIAEASVVCLWWETRRR